MPAFFDSKSKLLDLLYKDSKTKKNNFEHWQLTDDRVILFDADKSRNFFVSFQNCGYTRFNAPTENYARDQILKYAGEVFDYFGDAIETVLRVGYRETRVNPVEDFDSLSQRLIQNFVKTDGSFFKSLNCPMYDVALFPMVFKHGSNKFQVTLGPMKKDQLQTVWEGGDDLPDQALFADVDYYAIQPPRPANLRNYVAEFLSKARDVNAKIVGDFTANILNL